MARCNSGSASASSAARSGSEARTVHASSSNKTTNGVTGGLEGNEPHIFPWLPITAQQKPQTECVGTLFSLPDLGKADHLSTSLAPVGGEWWGAFDERFVGLARQR